MTITYEYEGALYVNLTNECNCACNFCLRHGEKEGSIYTEDSLWLEHEPSRQEALDSFLSRGDLSQYTEIVFCGYGEPTYRVYDIIWLVDALKARFTTIPPVRINTNGHANLILSGDVVPDLVGRVDVLSISLNATNAEDYVALCHPVQGAIAYTAMLDFTREAAKVIPMVVLTIVDFDKTEEEVNACYALAAELGATLRVRSFIDS